MYESYVVEISAVINKKSVVWKDVKYSKLLIIHTWIIQFADYLCMMPPINVNMTCDLGFNPFFFKLYCVPFGGVGSYRRCGQAVPPHHFMIIICGEAGSFVPLVMVVERQDTTCAWCLSNISVLWSILLQCTVR
jgi:hypothetical protein